MGDLTVLTQSIVLYVIIMDTDAICVLLKLVVKVTQLSPLCHDTEQTNKLTHFSSFCSVSPPITVVAIDCAHTLWHAQKNTCVLI